MDTNRPRRTRALRISAMTGAALTAAFVLAGAGPLLLGSGTAEAIVGRPLTPVSYAGVARRTTRRTVAATSAVAAAHVTALPAGCATTSAGGGVYYHCGATWYQPQYSGATVVYVAVEAP